MGIMKGVTPVRPVPVQLEAREVPQNRATGGDTSNRERGTSTRGVPYRCAGEVPQSPAGPPMGRFRSVTVGDLCRAPVPGNS